MVSEFCGMRETVAAAERSATPSGNLTGRSSRQLGQVTRLREQTTQVKKAKGRVSSSFFE